MRNFTQIPNILIQTGELTANEKAVLFYILSLHPSFPSLSTIAKTLGISRDTVNRAKNRLVELRIISYDKGSGVSRKANEYVLTRPETWRISTNIGLGVVRKSDSNNTNKKNITLGIPSSDT